MFCGNVTLKDYINFCNRHNRIKNIIKYICFLILTVFSISCTYYSIGNYDPRFLILYFPISFLLTFSILICFIKLMDYIVFKSEYKSNIFMQEEQSYAINENNIFVSSKSYNKNFSISDIKKIIFDKDSIYIYVNKIGAYIITKQFFKNENDYILFNNLINKYYK